MMFPATFRSLCLTVSVLVLSGAISGCAVFPPLSDAAALTGEDDLRQCAVFFQTVDESIAAAGVADGMAAKISGFPHLRVNRLLADYARHSLSDAEFGDWLARLARLGAQAYDVELANLPGEDALRLAARLRHLPAALRAPRDGIVACSDRFNAAILARKTAQTTVRAAARVEDDYSGWKRALGLYWLTRLPFAAGIRQWHEETRRVFETPLDSLAVRGRLTRYVPPRRIPMPDVAAILRRASANPLGVPDPQGGDRDALFDAFAPEFVIDVATDADRIGALGWRGSVYPDVDTTTPVVYRRFAHTRHQGRVLLQLVYSVWFPARPLESEWDLLGGHLDGLVWRVTLEPGGSPWVYDSMHSCGCYHEFFPTARAMPRFIPDTLDETAFVPQTLASVPGPVLSLRIESGTHYLQRVISGEATGVPEVLSYRYVDDDSLRSAALPDGGRRSVFDSTGIVPGSDRGERFWFWPMGISSPGAMRQWGRHATAFVGRRHFDDPDLPGRYFGLKP